MAQLRVKGGAAVGNVFLPALFFEPLPDLGAGLGGLGDFHPVPAGAFGVFGGKNLHNIAVFQHMIQRDDAVIDLGTDHAVAHGGVNGIGEVDGGGSGGQILYVAVGGEHKHLVGEHIHLQGVDEFLRVGALLIFQQAAHPLVLALGAGALPVLLILPVGGYAVFGNLMHLFGADLHLEGNAVVAHDGGVKALVAVGLGGADIVLEPAQNGLVQVVDHAQHVVAVADGIHDHPESKEVEDLVDALVLAEHLPIDGVGVLHAAVNDVIDLHVLEPLVDLRLGAVHESLVLRALGVQLGNDLIVADGIQIFQGEILQLPFHPLHSQPVGDGRIDLHGFQRFLLLLGRGLVFHGTHIVEPVGDLDEDDPDILAHGDEHLPEVLHLLVFLGGVLDAGQLADALHQVGDGGREQLLHVLVGGGRILDDVVEQGGHDGLGVQLLLRHDLGNRQGVDDIGLPAFALLAVVALVGIFEGRPDLGKVRGGVIHPYGFFQIFVLFLNGHAASPQFRLAAPPRSRER